MVKSNTFTALEGNVSIELLQGNILSTALQNTDAGQAYRFALVNSLPFALTGDVANTAAASSEYDLSNFTDQYLQDRADYLSALLQLNAEDAAQENISQPNTTVFDTYTDTELGGVTVFNTEGGRIVMPEEGGSSLGTTDNERRFFKFGSESADNLEGNQNDDRLYGLSGNDTLDGGKGNDYLEGAADHDDFSDNIFYLKKCKHFPTDNIIHLKDNRAANENYEKATVCNRYHKHAVNTSPHACPPGMEGTSKTQERFSCKRRLPSPKVCDNDNRPLLAA